MLELRGKFNEAKIFTDVIEGEAISQIIGLLNEPFTENSKIRLMPDVHPGAGCTVGLTMSITDKVVPNLVGVDVGCGVFVGKISEKDVDFKKLDEVIKKYVPSGFEVHKTAQVDTSFLDKLICKGSVNIERARLSAGSLGGGNHFCELSVNENGDFYLLIHTGSRSLGLAVAKYYQKLAVDTMENMGERVKVLVDKLKKDGREKDIASEIEKLKKERSVINKDLAYLEGENMQNYLHDVSICQKYASLNRNLIAEIIAKHMGWKYLDVFNTIHNYIDMEDGILRKGAVSAKKGEKLVIPINMRDGSLICIGKGNPDWNQSVCHGAGRLRSRSQSKKLITMEEFKDSMEGIYSTTVNLSTLDEAPMAYKPIESILDNIGDSVDIVSIIRPVYNFKAGE